MCLGLAAIALLDRVISSAIIDRARNESREAANSFVSFSRCAFISDNNLNTDVIFHIPYVSEVGIASVGTIYDGGKIVFSGRERRSNVWLSNILCFKLRFPRTLAEFDELVDSYFPCWSFSIVRGSATTNTLELWYTAEEPQYYW